MEKRRKRIVLLMQAQYWELDPYIRGRGAYHRHGNVVGNGLVTFEYPSESGERAEGEWECFGYKSCREEYILRAEQLAREIKAGGGEVDTAGAGAGAKSKSKKKAKKVVESESESD